MDGWTDEVVMKLSQLAKNDCEYQLLLNRCRKMEVEYLAIMNRLAEEERLCIDEYIVLCEELQYRMTQLAYGLGVLNGYVLGQR